MPHNRSMPDCLSSLLLRPWCTVPGSQSDTRPPRRGRAGSTDSRPRRAWLPVRRAPTAIQHVLHRRLAASPSHRGITGASGRLTAGLKKTPFAMQERTLPGAAGVSPPWLGKRNCRNASGKSGRLPAVCSQTWSSLGRGHTGADALPWIGKQLYAYGGPPVSVTGPTGG
jgi:hypothetical protein